MQEYRRIKKLASEGLSNRIEIRIDVLAEDEKFKISKFHHRRGVGGGKGEG